ncbi:MAG: hypothetical protein A3G41_00145 [Elusimicrobia bacterium RIFCSPLOWO2_12_FULL_59_9]|nr:MAG: hypothetical protein A3G41_00145 [Elusimicrobia bacterium RIFCSPLOWO2_12_FULL_59_9]
MVNQTIVYAIGNVMELARRHGQYVWKCVRTHRTGEFPGRSLSAKEIRPSTRKDARLLKLGE